jgi:hypothetical protein
LSCATVPAGQYVWLLVAVIVVGAVFVFASKMTALRKTDAVIEEAVVPIMSHAALSLCNADAALHGTIV